MTKFNPDNKDLLTYAEALNPAMQIIEQEDADNYLKEYIKYMQKQIPTGTVIGMSAEQICKINLAYYSSYFTQEVENRIAWLFDCRYSLPK